MCVFYYFWTMSDTESTISDIKSTQIILVEGLDGTGKSTLCKQLHGLYPQSVLWHAAPFPDSPYSPIMQHRTWYEFECTRIPTVVDDKIILDRWWPSTLAFTEGYYDNNFRHRANLFCEMFTVPDVVFYLKCNKQTSKRRIIERDTQLSYEENLLNKDLKFRAKVESTLDQCMDILREKRADVFCLNTDELSKEELFSEAQRILRTLYF